MLTDALHARTGGDLGAASLPRHLRRRATSHNPYRGSTKHRPNAKRRRALDAAGLAPADVASRVGSATGAGVRVGTAGVTVHWCRRARRRPARLHAKHVDAAGGPEEAASRQAETGTDDDDDDDAMLARVEDVCGDDPNARTGPDAAAAATARRLRRLETHVWHAKRFEMRTMWGFALPESRPGRRRGCRSTSRWVRHACAVHDASYNACLRVEAEDVRACLSRCVEGGAMEVNPALRDDAGDVVLARTAGEVIAPAQVVSLPGVVEGDASRDAVLVWVHPDAVDDCEASLSNAGASVTRVRGLCRLELTGETALASLSAICDVGAIAGDAASSWRVRRCETRGDPREAAWLAKKRWSSSSPSIFQPRDDGWVGTPMERAARPATARELGARRREARKRSSGDEKEAPDDSDSLPGCPVVVVRRARGPLATSPPGFTIIAPRGWAQPLLLALVHLGARAAGRVEWGWLATQAGMSRFPEDFPDTDAGKRWFAAVKARNAARANVVPRGKRTPEPVVDGANLVVRRTSPKGRGAKGSEGTGTRQKRGKSGWRPVRDRDGALLSSSSSSSFVRCVVRCPWGGRARVGDAVLDPARRRELAWRSGVRRNRRHVGDGLADVGTPIGVVTSASPPGASVGVASALVNVAALRTVCSRAYSPATGSRKNEQKRPGGRRALVFLASAAARGGDGGEDGEDGDGPEAFVPAELTPALEAAPDGVDAAWW